MPSKEEYYEIQSSNLETIDFAFYNFINDKMNNFSTTNEGTKKIPVLWVTAERAFLSKNNKDLMDNDGVLKLPLISIERTSVTKDLNKKGAYLGNPGYGIGPYHGGKIVISRKIKDDKTTNFKAADNAKQLPTGESTVYRSPGGQAYYPSKSKKTVYETITMPAPVYLSINYQVSIRTEYMQQMNQLTTPFATLGGHINSFLIKKDGHQYEAFLQPDFAYANNVSNMGTDERTYETTFTFDVLGYIIGESPNGDRPRITKTENAVEVKIPREHVIFGDIPPYGKGNGFYRD